jgi:hypothetical protein
VKNRLHNFTTVRAGWETYHREVMPVTAGAVQIQECRRAFYAGAMHLFAAVLDNSNVPEAEAMQRLKNLQAELAAFPEAIIEGKA